ncbi:DUF523 domain-containing protein [Calorimonas adulescens]|jgi:Protein of unknown function (DUF523).|uniref:DUF523 domain-containing protein n=1 Tax=Calorimonas adulescens TaxID=2606906 RepID=A0A5D8QGA2_9THEO|nr:DUF523 domain-containing protein [Calorimonas adulescens]TZE82278.1 DUF523 domain-containing protein [Calorimonas adulescens]
MNKNERILVSACLAGFNCRYDGKNCLNEKILKLVMEGMAIPVCPEQLGGLKTPRNPAEVCINDGKTRVFDIAGNDVTEEFNKGARETLKLAMLYGVKKAVLKSKSPSCGSGEIYSGKFDGELIDGDGITARLLKYNGIEVIREDDL